MATMLSTRTDYNELVQDDRVSGRVYYDSAVFEEELEKIWYRDWIYIAHESEIPEPGDYVTRRIGLQPVIVSRDEDRAVHLLLNRCMHRGNTYARASAATRTPSAAPTTDGPTTIGARWLECHTRPAMTVHSAAKNTLWRECREWPPIRD